MTQLPEQRHSNKELWEMERKHAIQARPDVQRVDKLAVHPFPLGAISLICISAAGLLYFDYLLWAAVCASLSLLSAIIVFWKKPRSRHHATVIIMISLLVIIFSIIYLPVGQAIIQ